MARLVFYSLLTFLMMFVQPVHAQDTYVGSFRTELLRQLAQSLRLSPDSIPDGFSCKTIDGHCISIIKEGPIITHLGYHLFSEESHSANRSDVISFIERMFLYLMYPGERTQSWILRDYKLKFEKGGISDVKRIAAGDEFSMSIQSGKKATAVWSRDGKSFIKFTFPMEYSLLSGEDKVEAENCLEKDILKTVIEEQRPLPSNADLMTKGNQSGFYTRKGDYYIVKPLNSDTYYQLIDEKPSLLLDITFPAESSANLMLDAATGGDYQLNIKQILYGYKQKQFRVSLKQWLSFCHEQGCQLYFGVEKVLGTEIRASVIAVNEMAGYNHVMFVNIPFKLIDDKKGVVDAQIHAYVPMHNVTNLFESYKKKLRKEPIVFEK